MANGKAVAKRLYHKSVSDNVQGLRKGAKLLR